ncbi:ribbon-helix-helix protein, CopG family [Pseudonocardia sp. N23]|uniref:ribbon-helix-helix protein, CopG family n=1 Tax=Pseudonocardia sp. N23 TaxID=1987376 RepID=UPI000BFD34D7
MIERSTLSFPDPGLLAALDEAADEQRKSRSEFVRSILAEALGYNEEFVPRRSKLQVAQDSR